MATLEVNGAAFEVVGGIRFATATLVETSMGGGHTKVMPTACFIAATIRIPSSTSSRFAPPSEVRLSLDDGRTAYGSDLVETGNGVVHGDLVRVRFEGGVVSVE